MSSTEPSTANESRKYIAVRYCVAMAVVFLSFWAFICKSIDYTRTPERRLGGHMIARPGMQTPLRFAMVHDVIHQRFKKHGPDWYKERIRKGDHLLNAKAIQVEDLLTFDDVAVAYDKLQQANEGLKVLAVKERFLQNMMPEPELPKQHVKNILNDFFVSPYEEVQLSELEMAWYRHFANKGTLVIHAAMKDAMHGDVDALAQLKIGQDYIRKSVLLNKQAHFGREMFQLLAVSNLIKMIEQPAALKDFTIFGQALDPDYYDQFLIGSGRGHNPVTVKSLQLYCEQTDKASANQYVVAPFDELCMGIIGMWIYGGGANPHFALSLGIIMEDVGQARIAWSAYRRALDLSGRFWPEESVRDYLKDICEWRMQQIEERSDFIEKDWENAYQFDLNKGLAYQKAQAEYEALIIQSGKDIYDPHFFAAFNKQNGSIASPLGRADYVIHTSVYTPKERFFDFALLITAIGMALGYLLYKVWHRPSDGAAYFT